jgi:hypothetical protein
MHAAALRGSMKIDVFLVITLGLVGAPAPPSFAGDTTLELVQVLQEQEGPLVC